MGYFFIIKTQLTRRVVGKWISGNLAYEHDLISKISLNGALSNILHTVEIVVKIKINTQDNKVERSNHLE